MEVWADSDNAVAAGMGFAHAHDRLVQMSVVRLIGQGRLSECLRAGNAELRADTFARLTGFARYAKQEVSQCSPSSLVLARAYCKGVNHYLTHCGLPFEFRLIGYRPEPWSVEDTLLILKLMIYFLGHSQRQMEQFIIQAIRGGTSVWKLRQLFAPHLDGLTDEMVGCIKRVNLWNPPIPEAAMTAGLPQLGASNNWAIAGELTASGNALECHDPHLPCNFLPQPWYELVTHVEDRYSIGVSIPGIPGLAMGRNNDISVGFTYGFMDMMDYFVEECRDGKFLQTGRWCDFSSRTETIHRRRKSPAKVVVRENQRGVLEADPHNSYLPDGLYLCSAWSAREQGAARLLDVISSSMNFSSVTDVQQAVRHAAISANWVIADRQGNIGYQQSGLLPIRSHSGLYPLPGWDAASTWNNFVDGSQLATMLNPPCGFIATANDDLRGITDCPPGINLCMGRDRVSRIQEMLNCGRKLSLADMKKMQRDVHSNQAERFMRVLRPLLPADVPSSRLLQEWDLRYDAESVGATLFEIVYGELLLEVFGRRMFGERAWKSFVSDTPLLANYFHYFDACLLSEKNGDGENAWFGPGGRNDLYRDVLRRVLVKHPENRVAPLRRQRSFMFRNIMSPGRFGRLFGMDRGPVTLEGARASIQQCNVVRAYGWRAAIAPSYRYVSDLGTDCAETALAGGPSGRICSRHYFSDNKRWRQHEYKRISGMIDISAAL